MGDTIADVSRTEPTLGQYGGARSSVVERLADLYGNTGKQGGLGASTRPRRSRRSRRSSYSAYGAPRKKGGPTKWVVALVVLLVIFAVVAITASQVTWLSVQVVGVEKGDIIRGDQLFHTAVRIKASGRAKGDVIVMLNGVEVAGQVDHAGDVVVSLADAAAGPNRLNYRVKSKYPWVKDKTGQLDFTVRFGPSLSLPLTVPPPTDRRPAIIRGLADDDVIVTVNGKPASREAGMFEAQVPKGTRDATVIATDANGNMTKAVVKFDSTPVVASEPYQSFHVNELAWRWPALDKTLERLATNHQINSVVLTIKDEYGLIGYPTQVPLASQIGAISKDWRVAPDGSLTPGMYDTKQAIDRMHQLGLKAIGRITCFLDPQLAEWAVKNNQLDMVVQDDTGAPVRTKYGTAVFTNFANPKVRQYNIDLAVEAAKLGFDEIMFDYVRRPEGLLKNLNFVGLETSPQVGIAQFVRAARQALPPVTKLGLAVFGVSATRPNLVGQDIRLLAPLVDFVAPMVYPSHWVAGEYKVPIPMADPEKIVERSTADFVRQASTGGAYTVPWIEDFGAAGYTYGPAEINAQTDGAMKAGASGVFLWNAKIEYDFDALRPLQQLFGAMAGNTAQSGPTTTLAPGNGPPDTVVDTIGDTAVGTVVDPVDTLVPIGQSVPVSSGG